MIMTPPDCGEVQASPTPEKSLEMDRRQKAPRHPFINSMVALHLELVIRSARNLSDTAALLQIFEGLLAHEALLAELRLTLEVPDQLSTEELVNWLAPTLRDVRDKEGVGLLNALWRLHALLR
jgi:hypothetical protein